MRRLLPFVLLPAVLSGCFDFDCEEVRATVTWEPEAALFHVDMVLMNLGLSTFDCQGVEACVAAVRHAVDPLPPGPVPEEATGFWPAQSLAGDGATNIEVGLERRGDLLDLRMRFTGVANGDATEIVDVYVIEQGKEGRAQPHLMVMLDHDDTMEPVKGKRFVFRAVEEDGEEVTQFYVLPRKQRTIDVKRPANKDVVPMLEVVPGLEPALVEAGLLTP